MLQFLYPTLTVPRTLTLSGSGTYTPRSSSNFAAVLCVAGGGGGGYLALIERDKVNRRHMMANHKRRVTAIKATMAQAKAEPPTIDVTLAANATEAT